MSELTKVEIGSGNHPKDGYIHVDIRSGLPHQEYQASILDMPFENDSVDEIIGVAIIEHLEAFEVPLALQECKRILKKGGWLKIYTFNLLDLCKQILYGDEEHDLVTLIGWIYGRPMYPENRHRTAFTPTTLGEFFMENGFDIENLSGDNGLYIEGTKR